MLSANILNQSAWTCIHFAESEEAHHTLEEIKKDNLKEVTVDCSDIVNDRDLLARLSNALSFPEYFGGNWDALDECLRDLDLVSYTGCVLFLFGADALWKNATYTAGKLVTTWLGAAEEWEKEQVAFHLVFVLSSIAEQPSVPK